MEDSNEQRGYLVLCHFTGIWYDIEPTISLAME